MNDRIVTDEIFSIASEKLKSGGEISFTVTGTSMHPFFHDRKDVAFVRPIELPIKRNSIVFYRRAGGSFVLHRVVKVKTPYIFCRGDNQFTRPEPVDIKNVLGYVFSYKSNDKSYGMNSLRSIAVLYYVKIFYPFRKLNRKIKKICFRRKYER